MSMIWDNTVYELRFNDDLSINLEETKIVNKKTSGNASVISLNDGHEFSVSITNDNLASITNSILSQSTITDYIFFYPDKTQLFNKVVDDLRNMKALFDKSINEISMDCIKLLNKKEELINETDTSTAKFPDNIGLGYTMYANMSGKIVKFIATNSDSRNIVVISLEGKRLIFSFKNNLSLILSLLSNIINLFLSSEITVILRESKLFTINLTIFPDILAYIV